MNSDEYEIGFIEGYKYALNKLNVPLKISDLKKGQWFKLKRNIDGPIYLLTEDYSGYKFCVNLNGRATKIAAATYVVLVNPEEIDFLKYLNIGE